MSTMITGSICLSDMIQKAKEQHSSFYKGKNGKIYANVLIWHNDEPDKFGNDFSVQLNSKKEDRQSEGTTYIGNLKTNKREPDVPQQMQQQDTAELPSDDDLFF